VIHEIQSSTTSLNGTMIPAAASVWGSAPSTYSSGCSVTTPNIVNPTIPCAT